jgi:16S rRNA C967 or C1407 C5-methylase (RsmB/RsmF family)/NOL1/NOP2/fmu family ribosome biogenesis protein
MTNKFFPDDFIQILKNHHPDECEALLGSLQDQSPTSLRLHPTKGKGLFIDQEKIFWEENGRYLDVRPVFTLDPLFQCGSYYVQEASSMFVGYVLKQSLDLTNNIKVLDLCAAPGGKSTQLLSLINNESLVVSNEIIPSRNKILQHNIIKWGNPNSIVTQNNAADYRKSKILFDVVIVDAPCSGEGLFRKDEAAKSEWSLENVVKCSIRQTEILADIVHCLKPNGILIYSTCTFEPAENDDQILKLITEFEFEKIEVDSIPEGIVKTKFGYQFFPHKIKGEGFYLSILKNKSSSVASTKNKTKKLPIVKNVDGFFNDFLHESKDFQPLLIEDQLYAIPNHLIDDFLSLKDSMYVRHAGIFMGTIKGKDLIPSLNLALSTSINKNIPFVEVDLQTALTYLKCETINLNCNFKGWGTINFQGQRLGWIKVIPGRINNYFPKEYRILMDINKNN